MIRVARGELDFRSARRRSPADRCVQFGWLDVRSEHWVPLPAPGPPRTNTTWNTGVDDARDDDSFMFDIFFRLLWVNNAAEVANKKTEKGQTARFRV